MYAKRNKVNLTTADTLEELEKIKQYGKNMDILWRIAIKEDNSEDLAC